MCTLSNKRIQKALAVGLRRLWANEVLPHIEPQAVLISGDLVDGKEKHHHGRQLTGEWQVRQKDTNKPCKNTRHMEGFNTPLQTGKQQKTEHDSFQP